MANHILVKVGKLPGQITEIALNGGRKVSDALEAAGLSVDGYSVRVNGNDVDLAQDLREGDTVLLVKRIKGNADHILVKVGKLPGQITEIALNGGRKVSDALEAAGLSVDGYSVRVNGNDVDLSQDLREGDTVLLVKRIKGNC